MPVPPDVQVWVVWPSCLSVRPGGRLVGVGEYALKLVTERLSVYLFRICRLLVHAAFFFFFLHAKVGSPDLASYSESNGEVGSNDQARALP